LGVVAESLSQILGQQVEYAQDCVGPEVEKAVKELSNGGILLLDNLRFHPEEEKNVASFAQALAQLADIYVNDAFGAAHRNHASTVGVTEYLPAVAGFLLEKELNTLSSIIENPAHPFAMLLGGAKVSDKIGVIENIIAKVDYILIGGGMAATFLKAQSYEVGLSLVETDMLELVARLREDTAKEGKRMLLPVDVVVADELSVEAKIAAVSIENIAPNSRIVDIGPRTIQTFAEELRKCKTVFWNGPMGIYEIPQFAQGTQAMAELIANLDATTVVGGGSTAEIATKMGLADKMTFVSTGGGASLEFLAGKILPGVEALLEKKS
jgi:phosphoglycerate kinase